MERTADVRPYLAPQELQTFDTLVRKAEAARETEQRAAVARCMARKPVEVSPNSIEANSVAGRVLTMIDDALASERLSTTEARVAHDLLWHRDMPASLKAQVGGPVSSATERDEPRAPRRPVSDRMRV